MHFSTHIKIIILLEFYILNEKGYNGYRIKFLNSMESWGSDLQVSEKNVSIFLYFDSYLYSIPIAW